MNRKEIVNCPEYKAANAALRYWHSLPDEVRKGIINLDQEPDVIDAYEEGVLYGWNNPNWISVEEELPKIPEKWYCVEVLFRTKDSANHLGKYFGDDDKWISYEDYTFKTNDISHWMPIVPPRKEE